MMSNFFTTSSIVSSDRVLYTPSAFARSSLLYLQEIGELTALAPHTSSRSNIQSLLFFVVIDGLGELDYAGTVYPLQAGSCVFIDCRHPYSHTTSDQLWTLKWCHFYGPNAASVYQKYLDRGGKPIFQPSDTTLFISTVDQLLALAKSSDYIRDMRMNEHLSTLLTLIMAESWDDNKERAKKSASAVDVKVYIEEHYAEKITLDDLASRFFINKYYLTRVFKEQFGQSITTYLTSVRITHAKQLLRFSSLSIEEIGRKCGLGSAHYFSAVFKEVEGVPPREYRKQW